MIIAVGAVACTALAYRWGYRDAAQKYEAALATQRTAAAQAALKAAEAARMKEDEHAHKLADALAERDKALARAESLRLDAARVRQRADAVADRLAEMPGNSPSPGDGAGERLAECRRLLGEGARLLGEGSELAAEGAGLLGRVAADKDAALVE